MAGTKTDWLPIPGFDYAVHPDGRVKRVRRSKPVKGGGNLPLDDAEIKPHSRTGDFRISKNGIQRSFSHAELMKLARGKSVSQVIRSRRPKEGAPADLRERCIKHVADIATAYKVWYDRKQRMKNTEG